MYVNCQGALAIKIWPGIFILKNCEVHQNQKNGTKQPNGYILSAYVVKECDFSKFISNESVRVLYSGINSKKHELEHIFAIYTLSEIQEIVPSR